MIHIRTHVTNFLRITLLFRDSKVIYAESFDSLPIFSPGGSSPPPLCDPFLLKCPCHPTRHRDAGIIGRRFKKISNLPPNPNSWLSVAWWFSRVWKVSTRVVTRYLYRIRHGINACIRCSYRPPCILTYYPTYSPIDRFHFSNLKLFPLRSIEHACIRHSSYLYGIFFRC